MDARSHSDGARTPSDVDKGGGGGLKPNENDPMKLGEFSTQLKLLTEDILGFVSTLICIFYRSLYVPLLGMQGIFQCIYIAVQCAVKKWNQFRAIGVVDGLDGNKDQARLGKQAILQSNATGPFKWVKENDKKTMVYFIDLARKKSHEDIFSVEKPDSEGFTRMITGMQEEMVNDELWNKIKAQMLKEATEEQNRNKAHEDLNLTRNDGDIITQKLCEYIEVLRGDCRGPCGETPLLLAMLYSPSQAYVNEDLSNRVWKEQKDLEMVKDIWNHLPILRSLTYKMPDMSDYDGENVLHMAIAKRNAQFLQFFEENTSKESDTDLRKAIIEGKVIGKFRTVGAYKLDFGDSVNAVDGCRYGQHPLCWAACTNQQNLVERLLKMGADVKCRTEYSSDKESDKGKLIGGDTILHMLVRQSERGAQPEDNVDWVKDMFDFILKKMSPEPQEPVSDQVPEPCQESNNAGWTPLMLAAAFGSKDIFDHVLKIYAQSVNWAFGPYRGVSLEIQKSRVDFSRSGHSVLSLILCYSRKDLISNSDIKALLDMKWVTYAKSEFYACLWSTVVFLICFCGALFSQSQQFLFEFALKDSNAILSLLVPLLFALIFLKIGGVAPSLMKGFFDKAKAWTFAIKATEQNAIWILVALVTPLVHQYYFKCSMNLESGWKFSLLSSILWTLLVPTQIKPLHPTIRKFLYCLGRGEDLDQIIPGPVCGAVLITLLFPLLRQPSFLQDNECKTAHLLSLVAFRTEVTANFCMLYISFTFFCSEVTKIVNAVKYSKTEPESNQGTHGAAAQSNDNLSDNLNIFSKYTMNMSKYTMKMSRSIPILLVSLGPFFCVCDRYFPIVVPVVTLVAILLTDMAKADLSFLGISSMALYPFTLLHLFSQHSWFIASLVLVILSVLRIFAFLSVSERFGGIVSWMWGMRADVTTVLFLYGICLAAFSVNFTVLEVHSSALSLTKNSSIKQLNYSTWASVRQNASTTFLNSLEMGVEAFSGGNIDTSALTHGDPIITAFVSVPMNVLAHIITPLLMVNFLIAVMNKKQESVENEAGALWQLNRAKIIQSIDDELPSYDKSKTLHQDLDPKFYESAGDGKRFICRFDQIKSELGAPLTPEPITGSVTQQEGEGH